MKLYLRDINENLVAKWKKYFESEPDVTVTAGDIFEQEADAIVSPANSYGFMDGGIDLVYSDRFGWDLQEELQNVIRDQYDSELVVGEAAIVPIKGDPVYKWLISAPTMRTPRDINGTVNAYYAMRATLRAVRDHNRQQSLETKDKVIHSVLCPGLGTAIGRLDLDLAARQMYLAWRLCQRGDNLDFVSLAAAVVMDKKIRVPEHPWWS